MKTLGALLFVALVAGGLRSASGQHCDNTNPCTGTGRVCIDDPSSTVGYCADPSKLCSPACASPTPYCFTNANSLGDTVNVCGALFSGSNGDPIMRGFDGRAWQFDGIPGKAYAVYSDLDHAVAMGLFLGQMHDHNGTYIGSMGFRYKDQKVAVHLIEDGNLTLSLGGDDIHVGSVAVNDSRQLGSDKITVAWQSYRPKLGRAVTFTTGTLQFTVWSVPPGQLDEGGVPQPAYLNFQSRLLAAPAGDEAQGLIGETLQLAARVAELDASPEDRTFHGRGQEADYEVEELLATDFKFSLFGQRKPVSTTRRHMLQSALASVRFPVLACNGKHEC